MSAPERYFDIPISFCVGAETPEAAAALLVARLVDMSDLWAAFHAEDSGNPQLNERPLQDNPVFDSWCEPNYRMDGSDNEYRLVYTPVEDGDE